MSTERERQALEQEERELMDELNDLDDSQYKDYLDELRSYESDREEEEDESHHYHSEGYHRRAREEALAASLRLYLGLVRARLRRLRATEPLEQAVCDEAVVVAHLAYLPAWLAWQLREAGNLFPFGMDMNDAKMVSQQMNQSQAQHDREKGALEAQLVHIRARKENLQQVSASKTLQR